MKKQLLSTIAIILFGFVGLSATEIMSDAVVNNSNTVVINSNMATPVLDDIGVFQIFDYEDINCGGTRTLNIKVRNYGENIVTNGTIEIFLNGDAYQTINWTDSLAENSIHNEVITIVGAIAGNNTVSVVCSLPNGNLDSNSANNQQSISFIAEITNSQDYAVNIEIHTDNFPSETTWLLADQNGITIASGGPYSLALTTFTIPVCLLTSNCYHFTIYDSSGDGFCGKYDCYGFARLSDANGPLFTAVNFVSESYTFCPETIHEVDIGPFLLTTPESSTVLTGVETIQMEVQNFGLLPQTDFNVGYIFEGGTPVIETFTDTLPPGATVQHTFTPTVDMAAFGSYDISLFTALPADSALFNDTLNLSITHWAFYDASITDLTILGTTMCEGSDSIDVDLDITLTNMGVVNLTSADITVTLNGTLFQTVNWTGDLVIGASEVVTVTLTGLLLGNQTVDVACAQPNGNTDEFTANDQLSDSFNVFGGGTPITLELNTDRFPDETSWELADENGALLWVGGPYSAASTLLIETFCLDSGQCYSFTIYDLYGDGICCGGVGRYRIVNDTGAVLINGGVFEFVETNTFCLNGTIPCNVAAYIDVEEESSLGASDGTITIHGMDGIEPYSYSIDGGNSFQTSGVYTNLAAGTYNTVVLDYNGCEFPTTITIAEGPNGISETSQRELVVYPNPTNSHLTIATDQPIEKLVITDMSGTNVTTINGNLATIDVSNLACGIYLLHVQVESGTIRRKFVKE